MANKKINELSTRTPSLTDLILVGDPTSGYSYKCTVTALATIIETDIADAYVTLDTAQTISGAKTFSNNLTLTSVTNAATTQTKFLTLNGSNVVNYRTGSQVLADIGASDDTLVVHKAGDETITGIKTFSARGKFDAGINLKQGSGASLDTGYSAISADATTFYFHRATSIAALSVNNLTTTRTYTLQDANGTLAFLSDIPSLSGYVPTSRTLTINGTSYDLSANRTWSVGTVTSVGLSTGTTGTDISVSGSPITSSGTITLNIPTASATNRGALSSTDWSTFNNKQNALTLTTTGSSGAATLVGATLNIPNYTLSGLGGISGSGTTNYIPKFTSSSAIGNSQIFDDGTNVGINVANPSQKLDVGGRINFGAFTTDSDIFGLYTSTTGLTLSSASSYAMAFRTGATERMRLTSGGELLLNTTSDAGDYKLQVNGAGYFGGVNVPIYLSSNNSNGTILQLFNNYSTSHTWGLNAYTNGNLYFQYGATNPAFLSSTGNLEINGLLTAYGETIKSGGTLYLNNTDNSQAAYLVSTGSGGSAPLIFATNSSERMRLDASGNLGIGTSSPGAKLEISTGGLSNGGLRLRQGSYNYWDITSAYATTNADLIFYMTGSEKMRIDASGNLGLGVSPFGWSGFKAFDIGAGGSFAYSSPSIDIWSNSYYNGSSSIYKNNGYASIFRQNATSGEFQWLQAGSGTAGTAISFTQAMTLDASGRLGIGTTSPAYTLQVAGIGKFEVQSGATNNTAPTALIVANKTTGAHTSSLGSSLQFEFTNSGGAYSGGLISSVGGADPFTADLRFSARNYGYVEAMRITSGGNVSIGTTSNSGARVDIYRSEAGALPNAILRLQNSGNSYLAKMILTDGNTNDAIIGYQGGVTSATQYLGFGLGVYPTQMVLTGSGNVGIGTSSPNYLLDLQTTSTYVTNNLKVNASAAANNYAEIAFQLWSGAGSGENVFGGSGTSRPSAVIRALSEDNAAKGALLFATFTGGATNANLTEKMRITSGGYLGLSTTNAYGQFTIGNLLNNLGGVNFENASDASSRRWQLRNDVSAFGDFSIRQSTTQTGTTFTDRLYISSGGNVGIGTTSPSTLLYAKTTGDGYNMLTIEATGGDAGIALKGGSGGSSVGGWTIQSQNAGSMVFVDRNSTPAERMRITSGGQVGIGLTNPTAALEVNGGIKTSAPLGGTAQQWKFGSKVNATVVLITGSYIELEVGGTLYKLALVN